MRSLVVVLAVLSLAVGTAACGSSGSAAPPSHSHHVVAKAFCALSVYALYHDVRAHRLGWAAFQAFLAHHNCRQAFARPPGS